MEQDEEALWFASLEMEGEEESRLTLPNQKKVDEPKEKVFKLGGFLQEMEDNAHIQGEEAPFVSYQHPLPSYDTMNQSQKNWYFYWRSQVHQGIFLPTDPDYVYVLAFECILKVGQCEPARANRVLLDLLRAYGELNARLAKNLEVWALDFCLLEAISPTDFLKQVSVESLDGQSLNLIFHKYNQIFPLFLPASLLTLHYERKEVFEQLERYHLREVVEEILEKTFECADLYCHTMKKKRLLQIYGTEKKETCARFCYQSANLLWKKPTIERSVQNHNTYQKIFLFLGFFLDFTLFTLGKMWNITTHAPDSPVGSGLETVITNFLRKEFPKPPVRTTLELEENQQLSMLSSPPEKKNPDYSHIRLEETIEKLRKSRLREREKQAEKKIEVKEKKIPKIQLDFQQINQLRTSSDAVRDSLEVLERKEEAVDISLLVPVKKEEDAENNYQTSLFSLDLSLVDSLRKDSDEVRQALAVEEAVEEQSLEKVENSGFVLDLPEKEEEKVENLEILPEDPHTVEKKRTALQELPEELDALCKQLPEHLWTTLSLISLEKWEELERFAMDQFSMTELLVDEINALAVENIGDILLETVDNHPTFLEEYQVLFHIFKE